MSTLPAAAPPRLFIARSRSRSSLVAAYVLGLFGGCLLAAAGLAPVATPLARELIAGAGIGQLVVAAGLAFGARWAAKAAIVLVIGGMDAIAAAILALAIGTDPFGALGAARATAANTVSILVLVALGYWIVLIGARRGLNPA